MIREMTLTRYPHEVRLALRLSAASRTPQWKSVDAPETAERSQKLRITLGLETNDNSHSRGRVAGK